VKDLKVLYGDNEKAAASIQIGVARLGVRSMLCINSEGILWASSEIHYAACSRLPLVMVCPSRALEPPTTVYSDHDDFISQRDMGWLMFYCEDSQDVLDTLLKEAEVEQAPAEPSPAPEEPSPTEEAVPPTETAPEEAAPAPEPREPSAIGAFLRANMPRFITSLTAGIRAPWALLPSCTPTEHACRGLTCFLNFQ